MNILEKDEHKADWQDKDLNIEIEKNWVRECQQPMGKEMNYMTPEV